MKRNIMMQVQQDLDRGRPSRDKFVRDIMRGLQERESMRKEAEARAMIEEPCGYYANKSFRGKKNTKQAYQC